MLSKLVVLGIPFHLLSSSSWLKTCKPQLWDVCFAPMPDAQGGCLSCRAAFSLLTLQVAATASRLPALILQEWKAGDGKHFFFPLFQRKVFIQIAFFIFSPSGCCGCSLISDALACPRDCLQHSSAAQSVQPAPPFGVHEFPSHHKTKGTITSSLIAGCLGASQTSQGRWYASCVLWCPPMLSLPVFSPIKLMLVSGKSKMADKLLRRIKSLRHTSSPTSLLLQSIKAQRKQSWVLLAMEQRSLWVNLSALRAAAMVTRLFQCETKELFKKQQVFSKNSAQKYHTWCASKQSYWTGLFNLKEWQLIGVSPLWQAGSQRCSQCAHSKGLWQSPCTGPCCPYLLTCPATFLFCLLWRPAEVLLTPEWPIAFALKASDSHHCFWLSWLYCWETMPFMAKGRWNHH